jgi:cystathionine gamma-synthase
MSDSAGFSTRAIHAGQDPDPATGAVIPPIYATSTFAQDGVGGIRGGYEYSRSANPTRAALEECMAALEGGSRGFAFASGLAAEDTLLRTIASPGSHLVIPNDAYGGTFRLFARVHQRWGIEATTAHLTDLETVEAAVRPGRTTAVWVETPTNPLLNVVDIAGGRGDRACGRCAGDRRQHLRVAVPAAAAGTGSRHRGALHDEVLRWPL